MYSGGGGGGGMYGGARQQHDSGMTPLQQQVLNTISQSLSDTGIDINDLVRTMGQHGHNEAKVRYTIPLINCCHNYIRLNYPAEKKNMIFFLCRGAVDFLSNEGHIYSTIDENHFKSTDA